MRKSEFIASVSTFAGLSVAFTLLKLTLPFPPLPFLRFELAELPVFTAFFFFGFRTALSAAVVYWIALNLVGEFVPLGPLMKFAAVASGVVGLKIGASAARRVGVASRRGRVAFGIAGASVSRVAAMSALNALILLVLFPRFLEVAITALGKFGLVFASESEALLFVTLFVGMYNLIHMLFSAIPAVLIAYAVEKRGVARIREV